MFSISAVNCITHLHLESAERQKQAYLFKFYENCFVVQSKNRKIEKTSQIHLQFICQLKQFQLNIKLLCIIKCICYFLIATLQNEIRDNKKESNVKQKSHLSQFCVLNNIEQFSGHLILFRVNWRHECKRLFLFSPLNFDQQTIVKSICLWQYPFSLEGTI